MPRFRKKPVEIEAWQNVGPSELTTEQPMWLIESLVSGRIVANDDHTLTIKTLEGEMLAGIGDWIIKGVEGELYPCKPSIFEATYDPAGEAAHCVR